MAEWRARGYVADSDEEDDSQHTTHLGPVAPDDASHNLDETRSFGSQVEQDETAQELEPWTDTKKLGVAGGKRKRGLRTSRPVEQEEQTNLYYDELPAIKQSVEDQRDVFEEFEEVDELQQDHCKATPSAQLEAEFLQDFNNSASQLQPIPFCEDHAKSPRSVLSSPLSSGSSEHQGMLPPANVRASRPKSHGSLAESSSDDKSDTLRLGRGTGQATPMQQPHSNVISESSRGARKLRHRNPIQLHPYQIESEKYRQILKARGVKPLRIAQMEAEAASAWRDESQNLDYNAEDSQLDNVGADLVDAGSLSPIQAQNSSIDSAMDTNDIFIFGEDDLPDVNTLLSHSSRKYVGNGHKRRKIEAPFFKMPPGFKPNERPTGQTTPASLTLDDDDDVFDVPPSPPHSGSQTPVRAANLARPKFRRPRRTSSPALPTPVISSEPRRRAFTDISEDEQSSNMSQEGSRPRSSVERSDSSGSSSGHESSQELQRVQRKIRGVLPASWLKLDFKKQSKKSGKIHEARTTFSPERDRFQRGVARPLVPGSSKSPELLKMQDGLIELSEDVDSISEDDEPLQPLNSRSDDNFLNIDEENYMAGRWGEAMEDDRIDAMLPSTARPWARRGKQKKRQTNLSDFGTHSASMPQDLPKNLAYSRPRNSKITDKFDKGHKRKKVFRPPRLGILDAPTMRRRSETPVPRFLEIASRTAPLRQNKGRHSPSGKYLRLVTKDDDYDATETLREWREGTIAPFSDDSVATTLRQPLYPRSANNTLPSIAPALAKKTKELTRPSPTSNYSKSYIRSAETRQPQTSSDHLVQRQYGGKPGSVAPVKPVRAQQLSGKAKKRGQIVSTLKAKQDARPAMLQSQREDQDAVHAQALFERDLSRINRFDDGSGMRNVLRLFEEERQTPMFNRTHLNHTDQQFTRQPVTHRHRKRRPQRLDIPSRWSRASSTPICPDGFPEPDETSLPHESGTRSKHNLVGLGPFGTRYSDTFNIVPLPIGTCFHGKSIIGSGVFAKSLGLAEPNRLDNPRDFAVWNYDDRNLRWGPWNDTVSSELGDVVASVIRLLQTAFAHEEETSSTSLCGQAIFILSEIVKYLSDHLSFSDSVDRISCLQQSKGLATTLQAELFDQVSESDASLIQASTEQHWDIRVQASIYVLVLVNQMRQIAIHELVPQHLQDEVCSLTRRVAQQTLHQVLRRDLKAIETCLSKFKQPDGVGYIIGQAEHSVEALVIAQHVLEEMNGKTNAWEVLPIEVPAKSTHGVFNVPQVEESWNRLFALLPFFEFDAEGTLETGRRFKVAFDNWTIVKRMIGPVLEASLGNHRGQPPSFNAYCRALFGRCLHLINGWGWQRCESIIGTLFDFFARNGLAHLRNEESHGSPLFLEQLATSPSLLAEPEDRCFHIFLKVIGSGVKFMRKLYPEKRVRDLVWRLMPNHGRFHPKEEVIRQEDLDALRNHHDLLCTLYWASPPSCRPRLTVIRNLVHLETSHREACHINIRAWSNLVKFQLSTNEPVENLEPFAEWHDDLLGQILRQHTVARTEAEDQVRSARIVGGLAVSKELLELTIARNQRQVEAILSDALVCLKLAIEAARDEKAAAVLLSTTFTKVFELFNAGSTQTNKVIIQSLDVISAYASKIVFQLSRIRDDNDDSQDYGDWPGLEADGDEIMISSNETGSSPLQSFHEPLRHLLSNCFGSDIMPDDCLLLQVVDVWIAVAQVLVRTGKRAWTDYLDRFGNDSWTSLRDTEQTRKYTAYYLATLIEKDNEVFREHRIFFLTFWMGSLVERESLLKFQHRLTEALLNADSGSLITKNLPFWADTTTGRFRITVAEFSERRLSIVSSVLSNMRVASEQAVFNSLINAAQLRQDYKDLLKHLMATMKHNYQELGHGSNIRGAYVEFVHRVVELLQQHTSTLCPIDRFFTDNGAFPLPATDPTYVVGQLKNYALRLQDPRTPKQLAVFLQSVSERAAIDGQQPYLVGQLHSAMSNTFEDGASARPTLRSFLVKAIVPGYIEMAFGQHSGWILAMPYLQALQRVFGDLLLDLDGININSVAAVTSVVTAFLNSLRQAFGTLLYPSSLLEFPWILKTLSACYEAITTLLPVLDYLVRLSGPTDRAVKDMEFLKSFAIYTAAVLPDPFDLERNVFGPERDNVEEQAYADIRSFATQELKDTLVKNWTYHGMQWYVTRGSNRREVVVDVGLREEERQHLYEVLEDFFDCLATMPALGDDDDRVNVPRRRLPPPRDAMDLLVF